MCEVWTNDQRIETVIDSRINDKYATNPLTQFTLISQLLGCNACHDIEWYLQFSNVKCDKGVTKVLCPLKMINWCWWRWMLSVPYTAAVRCSRVCPTWTNTRRDRIMLTSPHRPSYWGRLHYKSGDCMAVCSSHNRNDFVANKCPAKNWEFSLAAASSNAYVFTSFHKMIG